MSVPVFVSAKFRFHAFLAMVLLVFVHGYNLNETYLQPYSLVREPLTFTSFFEFFTANGLFRFRIPMLFIISGYLFAWGDATPFARRIGKRARTLLLPYFLWSALALLFTWLLQEWPVTAAAVKAAAIDQLGDNRPYREQRWQDMLLRWTLAPTAFHLWFLRALFFYNLLYPLLRSAVTRQAAIWLPVFGLLWVLGVGLFFIEGTGLFFFSLGIWLAKRNTDLQQPPAWLPLRWGAILWVGASAAKTLLAFYLPAHTGSLVLLTVLHKVIMFSGLITVWWGADGLVRWWMNRPALARLTAFSFIIYALHVPLINYSSAWLRPLVEHLPFYRLGMYLGWPLVIIAYCVGTGWLLRRFMPGVYALLTGGRGF
ncbi:MAG TPA: acyltransferase [Lacibacter sp.]|nr:acyltransferase [Lacibacter sp.]